MPANRLIVRHGAGRQRAAIALLALASAALLSCVVQTLPLNSERIAARYGSYAVRIVEQCADLRVTSLESGHGRDAVTRTLAIVVFADAARRPYAALHRAILNGASIGATFKTGGWRIDKRLIGFDTAAPGASASRLADLFRLQLPATLAVHIYRFDVSRDGQRYDYATIVELHHPDYLSLDDLRRIYGDEPVLPPDQTRDQLWRAPLRRLLSNGVLCPP